MNFKQQFSQLLIAEFNRCEQAIDVAMQVSRTLSDRKVELGDNQITRHTIAEVQWYSFTSSVIKNSFLVTAYSFFEYAFRKYSEVIVTEHTAYKRKLSDMEKVYQYHSLLANIIPVSVPVIAEDWSKLAVYREIRNIIVHHNSILPGNTSLKTRKVLEADGYVEPETTGLIKVQDTMIKEMLNVGLRFLLNLVEVYDTTYPKGVFSDSSRYTIESSEISVSNSF